ncbi:TIGR03086 family metal-binding protein [Herbiconiux sp. KACC 21604]|uniref:TIGR03086 family metal-binding protein n=1 Tax=unclassified Herbiconiux TaxID=2618217 RepID=UPI001492A359|nr:TIGR03086 family metal-binding protein [Herbiconiux sp. SALV-R1]QJU53180.1 TIGR03086 family protein [Herbiconiux sp. SALV-R1]WPO88128.1 TIGR03086 family metal-binding protein [Herbiconiux sp. KACC 21604]
MLPTSAADRHRAVAGRFAELAAAVPDGGWDAPAPVEGWVARDVVRHLVTWLPALVAGGSEVRLPEGPSVDADPAEAWRVHAANVQAVLDDPVASAAPFSNPHIGELQLGEAIDRFYVTDVFLHSWDLATATGQPALLDPETCTELLTGMEPIDEMLRASGQYGPRVEVADDADPESKLMAFIGRDPALATRAR